MKRKNIFAFVQICLFVQSLCAAQEINFENGTEGESVHFVSGGNIVLSVRCAQNTNNKKRKYLLIEKDKECKQTTTTTVLYEEKNDIVARDHGTYAINKSGTKIAFLDDGCLTVYNLQQKKQEWNKKVECSDEVWPMTFNPQDDGEIIFYDIVASAFEIHSQHKNNTMPVPAATSRFYEKNPCIFHPKKTRFILSLNTMRYYYGNYKKNRYSVYWIGDSTTIPSLSNQCYSPSGRCVRVINDDEPAKIETLIAGTKYRITTTLEGRDSADSSRICFHPNKEIVYLLGNGACGMERSNSYLYSYNFLTGDMSTAKLINKYMIHGRLINLDTVQTNQSIAVSADGSKIGIALQEKCIILPTSYVLLYTEKVKKLLQNVHLLQWYTQQGQNQENEFPSDVIHLIIEKLLNLHYE